MPQLTGYETDINIRRGGTKGENIARWSFNVQPGVYQVSATWSPHCGRAANAPFAIKDGMGDLDTILVYQRQAPDNLTVDGENWKILGMFNITGSMLIVELTDDASGSLVADAIRIAPEQPPLPTVQIIDDNNNGGPDFSLTGPDWS